MLNNGHGGIGTPDGSHQGGHPMFGGGHPGQVEYKYDPTGGPVEYKFDPSKGQVDYKYDPSKGPVEFKYDPSANPNNAYLGGPSPPGMNGIGGGAHHSGGYCSQMSVNQNIQCPPNTKYACSGCRGPIFERYVFKCLDGFWHHSCLKCSVCYATLADVGGSCFTRDGMILCRNDYNKIFNSGTCHGCGQRIHSSEYVMRAGVPSPGSSPPLVYHVNCFVCSKCKLPLNPGDRYSVLNGAVFCENDALKLMKNGIGSPSNAHVANSNGSTAPPKKGKVGRPRRSRD